MKKYTVTTGEQDKGWENKDRKWKVIHDIPGENLQNKIGLGLGLGS